MHAEDAKVAKIRTANIDPSLLHAGGNYLIIGSDTRAFVDTEGRRRALRERAEPDRPALRHDHGRPHRPREAHGRARVVPARPLGRRFPGTAPPRSTPRSRSAAPQLTIETIEQDFDIPISHYLEVDFAGFRDIVNAIGSVPIYFPAPARDKNSGLAIRHAGCHNLNGDQALAYVRSRYYEYVRRTGSGSTTRPPTSAASSASSTSSGRSSRAAIHTVFSHPWRTSTRCSTRRVDEPHPRQVARQRPTCARSCSRSATRTRRRSRCTRCRRPPSYRRRPERAAARRAAGRADARPPARDAAGRATTGPEDRADHGAVDGRERLGRDRRGRDRRSSALADRPASRSARRRPTPIAPTTRSPRSATRPARETKAQLVLAFLGGAGKLVASTSAPERRRRRGRARPGLPAGHASRPRRRPPTPAATATTARTRPRPSHDHDRPARRIPGGADAGLRAASAPHP